MFLRKKGNVLNVLPIKQKYASTESSATILSKIKINNGKEIIDQKFNNLLPVFWKKCCDPTLKLENNYYEADKYWTCRQTK